MKFIYIDKCDYEVDIITDVLNSWNVPYKVKEERHQQCLGYYVSYNVEIDVEPAFYEYLTKEIESKTKPIEHLEDCFEMPSVEPVGHTDKKSTKQSKSSNESKLNKLKFMDDTDFGDVADSIMSAFNGLFKGEPLKEFCPEHDEDEEVGKLVKFDDLDEYIKSQLLRRLPIEVLRSKECQIRLRDDGISVKIIRFK